MAKAKKATKKAAKKQSKEQLTLAVLVRARKLIQKGWTKHNAAKDAKGIPTDKFKDDACKFCAYGAIARAWTDLTGRVDDEKAEAILRNKLGFRLWSTMFDWNDEQKSKKPVLALFDKTIAKLEAKHA